MYPVANQLNWDDITKTTGDEPLNESLIAAPHPWRANWLVENHAIFLASIRCKANKATPTIMLTCKKSKTCALLALLLVIAACTKDNAAPTEPTNPPIDTLRNGWNKIAWPDPVLVYDVFFVGDTGYCVTNTKIYRSTDGGSRWVSVFSAHNPPVDIGMGSTQNSAIISWDIETYNSTKVYFTTDAGKHFDSSVVNDAAYDIMFVNASTAFMAGRKLWKTKDAGRTWKMVYSFEDKGRGYRAMKFLDEANGFVSLKNELFATNDGGESWVTIPTLGMNPVTDITSFHFFESGEGFVFAGSQLGKYNQGNLSVEFFQTIPPTENRHTFTHFITPTTGYIAHGPFLLKTIDKGITWTREFSTKGASLFAVYFTDADHGWACGTEGSLYKYIKK